jgi:TRAP-type C4-dicarboxylate transport system permease small subunit
MTLRRFPAVVTKSSQVMLVMAGVILLLMMAITFLDVILRFFGRPIVGVFELVSFFGAGVIGFSMSSTSLHKCHVNVDFLVNRFPKERQNVVNMITRIFVLALFAVLSWYFFAMGRDFYLTHTVSGGLKYPYYPVAYGLGVSSVVQCLVLILDMMTIWRQS